MTAMQELVKDLQDMCPNYYNNNYNWLHNLIDKEKQQIIAAYNNGQQIPPFEYAEQYYNETFNK